VVNTGGQVTWVGLGVVDGRVDLFKKFQKKGRKVYPENQKEFQERTKT
jgi:hypothetical protein